MFLSPLSTNISEWNAVASVNKDNLPVIWKNLSDELKYTLQFMVLILRTCAVRGKHLEIPYLSVHALHY
jgi:hypothetical protein